MAGLSYLVRRGGYLHFRVTIPPDLHERIGRRELRATLGTGRMREARGKAFALAAFVRGLIEDLRAGFMADLTTEEIFTLTKREFRRILEEDRRARLQRPGDYCFAVRPAPNGIPGEDWYDADGLDVWERLDSAQAEDMVREKLAAGRWPDLKAPVLAMLRRFGVEVAEDDPVVHEACHEYAKGFIEAMSAVRKRERGFHDFVPVVFVEERPASTAPVAASPAQPNNRMLSDLIREYRDEKQHHGWKKRSERSIVERIETIRELMGDVTLASIDPDFAFSFRKKLFQRPKKRQSRSAKASSHVEMISPGTINNILTDIAAMFKWAKKRGWIAENHFSEMTVRDTTPAHKKRQPFTREELALLLGPQFIKACGDIPWRFWLPVLGLFTGARLDEIAQARVGDVRMIDGVWCLVVESSDEKSVKTLSGNRSIPLHSFLIQNLNFLAFVEGQRAAGEAELFPGLKRVQGRKGHYLSKWFAGYRDKLGIPETRTFHSLRKNFSNNLAVNGVHVNMIKRLDGHSLKGDITEHHYIGDIPVAKLAEHLEKLDYGVDLSHLATSPFAVGKVPSSGGCTR